MTSTTLAQTQISPSRFELLTGTKKKINEKEFWDKKYAEEEYVYGKVPAKFLVENLEYLPSQGKALDLGMGEGRNAVFLARKGFTVTGVDISKVAVQKAKQLADEFDVRINTVVENVDDYNVKPNTYDVIINFYFVNRRLHKKMMTWLKPGGIIVYEAHTDLQKTVKGNEDYPRRYLLREGELLNLFPEMKVLKFEEPLHQREFTTSIILKKN